jgi:hypothetical protein
MGARLVKFDICPEENEQIEVVVRVPEEKRSVIHGIVKDCTGKVVKDAVVKLFEVAGDHKNCSLTPITHTFTDECGQFIFGPLCAKKKYTIKVWFNDVSIRELVVAPDHDCGRCLSGDCNNKNYDNPPCTNQLLEDE